MHTLIPMSEELHRGRRAIETGPTGKAVGQNLAILRKRRDLTTRQLSKALADVGRPIPASGITRMEQGERQVTVDDLMALAIVLEVPLVDLLIPASNPADPAAPILVTPTVAVHDRADLVWWLAGDRALPGMDEEAYGQSPRAREVVTRRGMRTDAIVALIEDLADVVGASASEVLERLSDVVDEFSGSQAVNLMHLDQEDVDKAVARAKFRLGRTAAALKEGRGNQ